TQVVPVGFHVFTGNTLDLNQFMVVFVHKGVVQVQHIGEPAGHAGTKVVAGGPQHGDQATGHVFAAVIASTFNHGMGAGVTNRKALTGGAGRKQLATSCAIQTGVTDNGGVLGLEIAATGRLDHQLAAGHAFTHVVVGITLQNQVQTTDVPDTEALASGAGQVQGDGGISHALITM